jgi:hypothetical protein
VLEASVFNSALAFLCVIPELKRAKNEKDNVKQEVLVLFAYVSCTYTEAPSVLDWI